MKRRLFLATAAAGFTGAAWARYVEPDWFEVTHNSVSIPGVRPKRILHISDLHMSDGMTAPDLAAGLEAGLAQRPDLICFTGDFVTITHGFDRAGLSNLLRRAVSTAPTFAVLGNHDGGVWLARRGGSRSIQPISELVTSAGVRLLHNQSAVFEDLTIVGMGDLWGGQFAPHRAFSAAQKKGPTIVLCHNPDGKDSIADRHWDLMLSGHTHGGQARIPGLSPEWIPVKDKRFIAGLYQWNNRQLYISRGIGSPKHVRAFCRPEVAVLHVG